MSNDDEMVQQAAAAIEADMNPAAVADRDRYARAHDLAVRWLRGAEVADDRAERLAARVARSYGKQEPNDGEE